LLASGLGAGMPLPPPPPPSPPRNTLPPASVPRDGERLQQQQQQPPPSQQNRGTQHPPPPMLMIDAPPASVVRDRDRVTPGTQRPYSIRRPVPRSQSPGSMEKEQFDDPPMSASGRELDIGLDRRITPMGREGDATTGVPLPTDIRRRRSRRANDLSWIVPESGPKSVEERINPTMKNAQRELTKYTRKAQMTGYSLNVAIGLQVVISALITGLSAVTTGRHTSIMTSILGGLGTVVASYLARARGSGEPELSTARAKDLEKFIRECEAFIEDHGYEHGHTHDQRIEQLRNQFEQLLGNGDSQRRLQTPM